MDCFHTRDFDFLKIDHAMQWKNRFTASKQGCSWEKIYLCSSHMMSRTAILLLFLCNAPCLGSAQSSAADSLRALLQTVLRDTQRVNVLCDYAWEIGEDNPPEATLKLKEAIALAQRTGFRKGEATAWNGLGVVEEIRGNIDAAIEHHRKALEIRKTLQSPGAVASQYNNLGTAFESAGRFDEALNAFKDALSIAVQIKDTARMARLYLNMGGLYEEMGSYPEAYEQVNLARAIFDARGDREALAKTYPLLGHIRFELEMYEEASRWYHEALYLREALTEEEGVAEALSDLGNCLDEMQNRDSSLVAVEHYQRALKIYEKMNDQRGIAVVCNNLGTAYKHLEQYGKAMQNLQRSLGIRRTLGDQMGLMEVYNSIGDVVFGQEKYDEALSYTEKYFQIAQTLGDKKFEQKGYKDFSKIYAALGDFPRAYDYRVRYDELRYQRLSEARDKDFNRKEARAIEEQRRRDAERQIAEIALRDAKIARSNIFRNALIGGALLLLIMVGMLFNRNRLRAQTNKQLAAKNRAIERERERADGLLRNILPDKAAEELKLHNSVTPTRYESVTVMFTDFQGFTKVAELVPPEDLIAELDECFRLFDSIVERYGLEKIKTIGDSYMCAGGLPTPTEDHAEAMVRAAIEMQHGLAALMVEKEKEGKPVFVMRIGIHTGPVVAGVVGSHKFAYDIWGDTVNTAARLEQGSEAGKINVSNTTHARIKDLFQCTYRGRFSAKNKGEIDMYFVEY
jgi:adenylate cyclase